MSIMPRSAYQQGIPRRFTKLSRFDYLTPEFCHVGEQAVYNRELFVNPASGSETVNKGVFGYIGRYDEYRRRESSVHGAFRSSQANWHLGRIFSSLPALNSSFVTANPTDRIFAVSGQTGKSLAVHVYNNVRAIRPLPSVAVPGMVDHG